MSDLLPDSVRERVIAQITPTKEEIQSQNKVIKELTSALVKQAEICGYRYAFIEAQGSTGRKQTQLRGAADIDLFVGLRPEEYQDILDRPRPDRHKDIDSLMSRLVENWFAPAISNLEVEKVQRAFSQHPFLSLRMKAMDIDILGCFDIDASTLAHQGPITAVDRTVHHSRFVSKHLTRRKREDARILKSFARACHAYGDTCAVGRMGLTGVSLELLVIASKDLDDAFWKLQHLDNEPLDPLTRTLEELRKTPAFRDDYVFVIDPTDTSRNVASSFSPRAYRCVQYRAVRLRELLASGNQEDIMNKLIEAPIQDDGLPIWLRPHSFAFQFKSDGTTHYTILRDKIHRMAKRLQAEIACERTGEPRFGEAITEVYFRNDFYALGLLIERPRIARMYLRRGPPAHLETAAAEFRLAHPNAIVVDGYLCVEEEREWTDVNTMIEEFLRENPIEGLLRVPEEGLITKQVLNVLYKYVLPIEPLFHERMTRVKHTQ